MCVDKLGSEKQQKATKAVAQNWLWATEILRKGGISRGPGQIYEEKATVPHIYSQKEAWNIKKQEGKTL